MKPFFVIFLFAALPMGFHAQTATYSYVRARAMTNSSGTTWLDHIDYDKGLGQIYQQVDVGVTPTHHDLVVLHEYDAHRRPVRTWLPGLGNGGNCQDSLLLKESAQSLNNDTRPFTWNTYEQSPLNRVNREYLPGEGWQQYGKFKAKSWYVENAYSPYYKVMSLMMTGSTLLFTDFLSGNKIISQTVNEDNTLHLEFKDKDGNIVVKRTIADGNKLTTYFVYDDSKRLRFVLPPEAASYFEETFSHAQSIAPDHTVMLKYGYEYRYDGRGNCIYKRLPGADPVYYIFDKADRCIFSQTGVQRTHGTWSYSIPDIFGRVVITGTCHNMLNYTAEPLHNLVVKATHTTTTNSHYGYTITGITLSSDTLYSACFYDNYSYIGSNGIPMSLSYSNPPSGNYGSRGLVTPRGLSTGMVTARFGPSGVTGYDYAAMYYDDRGQVVQKRVTNHLGGTELEYVGYDFTGHVQNRRHVHTAPGQTMLTQNYTSTYDHAGRMITSTHQLNNNGTVTLASNSYDELGRLMSSTHNGALSTTYTYNVRSWLKSITVGTLFSENLYYNESHNGNTPCYTENISAMEWKADAKSRAYNFTYDGFSRLTGATYRENNSNSGHYNTQYTYDRMGNLLTLKRYGLRDNSQYGLIDNLNYTYNGNQVKKITDAVSGPYYAGVFHFTDGSDAATEYEYDQNGNLTKDLNKNISSVQYNLLNLPSTINYQNGNMASYVYNAEGTKLSVTCQTGTATTTTQYCGNVIYENGLLKQLLIDGGYITFSGTTPQYHFYLKDHLGNNRVVVSQSGTVEQVNHYYPFGGLFGESTGGDVQRFKYNGKELDRMHGLDWYDYGARHLNAALGRWSTIDPMAEKYYNLSPYNYCGNNPVNAIDPNGQEKIDALNPYEKENNEQRTAARNFKDEELVVNIWAHGSSDGMTIYDKEQGKDIRITTSEEFLTFLNHNSNVWQTHKKGEPVVIVLHSCKTGKRENGRDSFAQILSKGISDAVIIAPSDNLYVSNGQEIGTFNSKIERTNTITNSLAGTWNQYENGTYTRQYAGNSLPGESGYKIVTNNSSLWDKFVYNISKLF